ncbi:acyl carrier protein [Sulfuricurvum sp.]|uniref:acyl carrier protein n=1 Tax=Sulfuricurvum sp. TaxID=2025608 RepID=UPI002634C60B|nr:acyl carrier protein [Sulfuricurvum sp.]MDD2780477.1 acyl carrier protein [Sulfuricurvum sp.]
MKEHIFEIISSAVRDMGEELENETLQHVSEETKLFGNGGALDSLALVSLIADVEEKIYDTFERAIVLADERAMSQRTSPFRDVGSLCNYVEKLLND